MTILQVVLDNPETIQKQIKQLRDLVIKYHFEQEPFIKTYGGLIASGFVVLFTIIGQWMIFKLTKNKDIKLKVAELYGKFKSKSMQYSLTLMDYNIMNIYYLRSNAMYCRYVDITNDEDYLLKKDDEYSEINCEELLKQYKEETEQFKIKYLEQFEKHKSEKLELLEILHQIHFYYNDKTLDENIEKYRILRIIPININDYKEEIGLNNFYDKSFKAQVAVQTQECQTLFKDITKILLKLSNL